MIITIILSQNDLEANCCALGKDPGMFNKNTAAGINPAAACNWDNQPLCCQWDSAPTSPVQNGTLLVIFTRVNLDLMQLIHSPCAMTLPQLYEVCNTRKITTPNKQAINLSQTNGIVIIKLTIKRFDRFTRRR